MKWNVAAGQDMDGWMFTVPGGREEPKDKKCNKKAGRETLEKHLFIFFFTFQVFRFLAWDEQNKLTFQDKLIIDPDGRSNITEQDWDFKKTFKVGETKTLSESKRKHNYFFSLKQSAHLIVFYHLSFFFVVKICFVVYFSSLKLHKRSCNSWGNYIKTMFCFYKVCVLWRGGLIYSLTENPTASLLSKPTNHSV